MNWQLEKKTLNARTKKRLMPGQKKLNARTNWQVRKNDLALPIARHIHDDVPCSISVSFFLSRMYLRTVFLRIEIYELVQQFVLSS